MLKTVILADDYTGALDTGVQFSSVGITTVVVDRYLFNSAMLLKCDDEVLVVNTETRHIPASDAYKTVRQLSEDIKNSGIPYLYIKTDSGLRGNIGSSLKGAVDGWGSSVVFIPAYPEQNRITIDGIQFIDGIPVSKSVFGRDLFNPVKHDSVYDIIREQTDICVRDYYGEYNEQKCIIYRNTASDGDMLNEAGEIKQRGDISLFAGCAGFAKYIPYLVDFNRTEIRQPVLPQSCIIISGCISETTETQIDEGEKNGLYTEVIDGLMIDDGELSEICRRLLSHSSQTVSLLKTMNKNYAGIDINEAGVKITENLGKAAAWLIDSGYDGVLCVFGGDTLYQVLKSISAGYTAPLAEIEKGVVLSEAVCGEKKIYIISKSGNLGSKDIISKIINILIPKKGK